MSPVQIYVANQGIAQLKEPINIDLRTESNKEVYLEKTFAKKLTLDSLIYFELDYFFNVLPDTLSVESFQVYPLEEATKAIKGVTCD